MSNQRSTLPPALNELDALLLEYVTEGVSVVRNASMGAERPGQGRWSFEKAAVRHSRITEKSTPWFVTTSRKRNAG
ncbi:MAG TPA: hypothetical protein PLJ27_03450 [Polyangiaceae bacterium]|nr:hypothetical protein [Polyangiaceae bacterium]HNZ22397.1 hypothetical protein [Polyangiaceae bacterium]HOD20932.1 hypothetical protein [Polyangiaceae bacterium]HOE48290.1 hypothetical protein [Polyangiaceae bacterium]HOH00066.1 hypothetical protein [Polyangiaceae bacterium]